MFSQGHLIWIGISLALIAAGAAVCLKRKPPLKRLLLVCLALGIASEVVKVLSLTEIVPVVTAAVEEQNGAPVIVYRAMNDYTPYLAVEHLPLEMCSLQLFFMLAAYLMRPGTWRTRLLALMFATALIGGAIGIFFASITSYFRTPAEYFASPRVWQYFLYHSMIVVMGLYIGRCPESGIEPKHWKTAVAGIVLLDLPTFYLNSLFSSEVYANDQLVGVTHRINFFSSYVNPIGLVLTEKWQWMVYLAVRIVLGAGLVFLLFLPLRVRGRTGNGLRAK